MTGNHRRTRDFSLLEVLLILAIIGIIGFVGWYVYSAMKNTNNTYESASKISISNAPKFAKVPSKVIRLKQSCSTSAPTLSAQSSDYGDGCKFSGTITADECATSTLPIGDVGCSVTVGKNLVYVMHGNINTNEPWGTFSLQSVTVGKNVTVFAHQTGPSTFTLVGSASYYVKVDN